VSETSDAWDELIRRTPVTRTELIADLTALGVEPAGILMVHSSLSSLGFVVGGADTVVTSVIELLGPSGTLVVMTGWEHDAYAFDEWPSAVQEAYRRDPPPFDPEVSEAQADYGRVPERVRTWPGARNSTHPECRFTAIGRKAGWITADQPMDHPYGPGSPLAKLVAANGSVLMLGAPLETITLFHHAEELANVPDKKIVHYSCPIKTPSGVEWVDIEDIDTSIGAFPYAEVTGERDAFEVIAEEALAAGVGKSGPVGESTSHLFPAPELVRFAVDWMEKHFGSPQNEGGPR
jgi:aminoglycoside 3-N-acetyltransferase